MNDDLHALLSEVVERLEHCISQQEWPAIVALQGHKRLVLTDYDYLHDESAAASFEERAAGHARRIDATQWVLAVPQVWVINERSIAMRAPSHHPLRPGEQETITWMACDHDDGVDYGRVPYTRRPNGDPIFDAPEIFTVPLASGPHMPGNTLLRTLTSDDTPSG